MKLRNDSLIAVAVLVTGLIIAFALVERENGAVAPAESPAPEGAQTGPAAATGSSGGAAANEAAEPAAAETIPVDAEGPRITVASELFDVGVIPSHRPSTYQMPVYNRGNEDLVIERIATTCGCTVGKLADNVVPPGRSRALEVTLDPSKIAGFESTKTLTLFTNDSETGPLRVTVRAKVDPEFEVVPERVDFGKVERGESRTFELVWRQLGDTPVQLKGVRPFSAEQWYTAQVQRRPEDQWLHPGKPEYDITVQLLPTAPPGSQQSRLILMTDSQRVPNYTHPVSAEIHSYVMLQPAKLSLAPTAPGQTHKGALRIRGEGPFEVLSVRGDDAGWAEIIPAAEPDGAHQLAYDIRIRDDAEPGRWTGTIQFEVRAQGEVSTETAEVFALIGARRRTVEPAQPQAQAGAG